MMRKWLDIPSVWLLGALCLAYWQARAMPAGLSFGPVWADLLGGLLVGGGLLVALLALAELRRNRTSFMPHDEAARLVTGGIFRLSRNPIYLGDVLILAGLILFWDAVLSLVLVPIFVWVVEKRFIEKEEYRLKRKFLASYGRYSQQTRRWI
ncbi:MAG: isoprenylcysteine carboxylmethyltransferase family protein [Rhodobacteraceae bacterium]|jgi:protein-S-isoprenylcysteine O-methyltransferase Ste14|nr:MULTISPECIES: isoprenylcysteine carboxylmethyltransferase family protein [Salipiger]MAB08838.1 isoprenylcysteine carboxylmethyltransferase family protein [Paracoccaceae bacterium]SFC21252.1 Protein-S-isoprenylcysteine O-methyltransferase Ste14 [Salipiger profundus]